MYAWLAKQLCGRLVKELEGKSEVWSLYIYTKLDQKYNTSPKTTPAWGSNSTVRAWQKRKEKKDSNF